MIVLTLGHYDIWYNILTMLFAQSDATATIYFIAWVCAAFIQERQLFESGIY